MNSLISYGSLTTTWRNTRFEAYYMMDAPFGHDSIIDTIIIVLNIGDV